MVAVHREGRADQGITRLQNVATTVLRLRRHTPVWHRVISEWIVIPLRNLVAQRIDILNRRRAEQARVAIGGIGIRLNGRTGTIGAEGIMIAQDAALAGTALIQEGIVREENRQGLWREFIFTDRLLNLCIEPVDINLANFLTGLRLYHFPLADWNLEGERRVNRWRAKQYMIVAVIRRINNAPELSALNGIAILRIAAQELRRLEDRRLYCGRDFRAAIECGTVREGDLER